MKLLRLFLSACLFLGMLVSSCRKDGLPPNGPNSDSTKSNSKSPDKSIDSLNLLKSDGSAFNPGDVVVSITAQDSIRVSVPPFTDITALTPVIVIKGKTVSPASGIKQDFSAPVTYTVTAEDSSQLKYTVVVTVRGVVYFGSDDNNFYAVDAVLGKILWKTTAGNWYYSDPTLVNGVIYAGNIDYNMYAMDAVTGAVKWQYTTDFTVESPPTVDNGVVFFGNDAHHFYALDAGTGQFKWQFFTGANISTKPFVLNGIVYFGSDYSYVYALDAASGGVLWKYQTGGQINQSSPSIANGVLYIGCRDGNLYALDAASGLLKWKCPVNNISLEQSNATVANGVVYIGGWYNFSNFKQAGSLYAIDATTGVLKWTALDSLGIGTNPTVVGGLLYINCDDDYLYAVDVNTHTVAWRTYILANGASPTASGSMVYCGGGGNHNFYALDAKTGTIKWTFPLGNNSLRTSTPIVSGRTTL